MITPDNISATVLREKLWEKHEIRVAGGHSLLKEKMLRIGHMGNYKKADIEYCIKKIKETINEE